MMMATMIRRGRHLMHQPPSLLRQLASAQFPIIKGSQLLEEEGLSHYRPELFYPVRIGEIFNLRYQVLGKLGYGAYSTVWLCRDLSLHRYVAVKVCTGTHPQIRPINRELEIYTHLDKLHSLHLGQAYIRELYGTFEIEGPDGRHDCLVHPPLHMTVNALQMQGRHQRYNEELLRDTLVNLFRALDYRHTVANVVHTDINAPDLQDVWGFGESSKLILFLMTSKMSGTFGILDVKIM